MTFVRRTIVALRNDGYWVTIILSCGHRHSGMGGDLRIGAFRNCFECSPKNEAK
jgi:hypothetical protein